MTSFLITGCNRGLGLGLVKQLLIASKPSKYILATCRNPAEAKELNELREKHNNLHVFSLDITNFDSFDAFAKEIENVVKDDGLNVLLNNAGVSKKSSRLATVKASALLETFQTNAMGSVLLTKALLPLIRKAAKFNNEKPYGVERATIVNMSSILGSIAANDNGGLYGYRMSKAAVNAATKSMSIDLKDDKILCVAMHPGWVQTDMGGSHAPLTVEESCRQMAETIFALNESHNGGFVQYNGERLEW